MVRYIFHVPNVRDKRWFESLQTWTRQLSAEKVISFSNDLSIHEYVLSPLPIPEQPGVVGAPQRTLQPASSIFSVLRWDLANSRPVHSSVLSSYLFFCLPCLLPLSLCLARRLWIDPMNRRHDHTIAVYISLPWSGLCVVRLLAGSWHGLPGW